jgi:hypothetical protein
VSVKVGDVKVADVVVINPPFGSHDRVPRRPDSPTERRAGVLWSGDAGRVSDRRSRVPFAHWARGRTIRRWQRAPRARRIPLRSREAGAVPEVGGTLGGRC